MDSPLDRICVAFLGNQKIAQGNILDVAREIKKRLDKMANQSPPEIPPALLIFEEATGAQVEIDLRGSVDEVIGRLKKPPPSPLVKPVVRPGRPKLGVVSREITLLPLHWEWLTLQPGGASVTLRKLVEREKKENVGQDQLRAAQNATYKFATVMAGNLPNFEEALRALFAKDQKTFDKIIGQWPEDIRDQLKKISGAAFQ